MVLNITAIQKGVTKATQSAINKLGLRELEETEPTNFIAFVDDGAETYDVLLKTNTKGDIIEHACDCAKGKTFCIHKTAVVLGLLQIKEAKPSTVKALPKSKKKLPFEKILDEALWLDVKNWLHTQLVESKDLQMSFTNKFANKKDTYTKEDVIEITKANVKAVVKNKKKIEQTELKKILKLWAEAHEPIIKSIIDDISNEEILNLLVYLHEITNEYNTYFEINSNKISIYAANILNKCEHAFLQIQNKELFAKAIKKLATLIFNENYVNLNLLYFLINLSKKGEPWVLDIIVNEIVNEFDKNLVQKKLTNITVFEEIYMYLLDIKRLEEHILLFIPIHYENSYNLTVIKKLIEYKHFSVAEKYTKLQITSNYREEYSVPYYELLASIYTQTKQEINLLKTKKILLPYTFNYDDYITVTALINDPVELTQFRTKLVTKARSNLSTKACTEFIFTLLAAEGNYKKMIESITSSTPLYLIEKYFVQMKNADSVFLFNSLSKITENSYYHYDVISPYINFCKLIAELIIKHYPLNIINTYMQTKNNYREPQLKKYLKEIMK